MRGHGVRGRRWNEQCWRVRCYISFLRGRYRQTPNFEQARHGGPRRQEQPMRPISCLATATAGGANPRPHDSHEIVAIAASDLEAKGRGNDVDDTVASEHHLADDINRLVVGWLPRYSQWTAGKFFTWRRGWKAARDLAPGFPFGRSLLRLGHLPLGILLCEFMQGLRIGTARRTLCRSDRDDRQFRACQRPAAIDPAFVAKVLAADPFLRIRRFPPNPGARVLRSNGSGHTAGKPNHGRGNDRQPKRNFPQPHRSPTHNLGLSGQPINL